MIPTATAAKSIANGLARPSRRLSSPGMANTLPPIVELMNRAVNVQRPIERTKAIIRLTESEEV
jgi:hypothetical protein